MEELRNKIKNVVKVLLDEDEQAEVEMKNVAVIMLDLFRPVVLKKDNCK